MTLYLDSTAKTAVVTGHVTQYKEGVGNGKGRVISIVIDNSTEIAFWNSELYRGNMMTRLKKSGVRVGSFLTVLMKPTSPECKKGTALNFMFAGKWKLEDIYDEPTKAGIIMDIKNPDENTCIVVMDDDSEILFKNPKEGETGFRLADRIRKKAQIGEEFGVVMRNDKVFNFSVGTEWEFYRNQYVIVGRADFIDFNTDRYGREYSHINLAVYSGTNNGVASYNTHHIFVNTPDVVKRVKEQLTARQRAVFLCSQSKDATDKHKFSGINFFT